MPWILPRVRWYPAHPAVCVVYLLGIGVMVARRIFTYSDKVTRSNFIFCIRSRKYLFNSRVPDKILKSQLHIHNQCHNNELLKIWQIKVFGQTHLRLTLILTPQLSWQSTALTQGNSLKRIFSLGCGTSQANTFDSYTRNLMLGSRVQVPSGSQFYGLVFGFDQILAGKRTCSGDT